MVKQKGKIHHTLIQYAIMSILCCPNFIPITIVAKIAFVDLPALIGLKLFSMNTESP